MPDSKNCEARFKNWSDSKTDTTLQKPQFKNWPCSVVVGLASGHQTCPWHTTSPVGPTAAPQQPQWAPQQPHGIPSAPHSSPTAAPVGPTAAPQQSQWAPQQPHSRPSGLPSSPTAAHPRTPTGVPRSPRGLPKATREHPETPKCSSQILQRPFGPHDLPAAPTWPP